MNKLVWLYKLCTLYCILWFRWRGHLSSQRELSSHLTISIDSVEPLDFGWWWGWINCLLLVGELWASWREWEGGAVGQKLHFTLFRFRFGATSPVQQFIYQFILFISSTRSSLRHGALFYISTACNLMEEFSLIPLSCSPTPLTFSLIPLTFQSCSKSL